jgi:hypothetical protein
LAGITSDDLKTMRQKVKANPLQPTKAMTDFVKHTKEREVEKRKVQSWQGFGTRPELRKKQRRSDLLAPPQGTQVPSDPVLLIAVHDSVPNGRRDPYNKLTGNALSAAAGFAVDSIRAAYVGSASTFKCMVWLEVFARGLLVQEIAGTKKRRFSAAYKQVKISVHFSTQFEEKQPALVERFRHFANMRKSTWKRAADAKEKKAHIIETLEDFRRFLLTIQRVPENSLSFSARCRQPQRKNK